MGTPRPYLIAACALAWAAAGMPRSAAGQSQAAPPATSPPRVLSLPSLIVPPDVEVPASGEVEVSVVVLADGSAKLETCEAGAALCDLVRTALAHARFAPARRDGQATDARTRVRFHLGSEPAAAAATPAAPGATAEPAPRSTEPEASTPSSAAPAGKPLYEFGARAQVARPEPGVRRLELAEMRDLPGAFGDPFRAVDALPGVVPALSGLPYFFVRGSPPAGTLYVYDDIPVPTLYHLALGPAVIHPRMVGPIQLYSGVAPARYGRLTGGVIAGEGPARPDGYTHAEAELRLLDVSAYLQTPGLGGNVTGAFRYGYPALLLSIFSPEVGLAYWDYQLSYEVPIDDRDRFELVALGSYDSFSSTESPENDTTLTFHRAEPRLIRRLGHSEFGAALLLGWEESSLGDEFGLQATRIGPRTWWAQRFDDSTRFRLSADMQGVAGSFTGITPDVDESRGRRALFGDVAARSMWGVQAELAFEPVESLELELGARTDAWVRGSGAQGALDPRARVIVHPSEQVELHVASGFVHQPAVFYIPLPGIADVANDRGLQVALQSEAGVGWDTPLDVRAELQLFLHRYLNLVFIDTLLLEESYDMICGAIDCADLQLAERIDGLSYGAELFLKRPITEDVSGWLSYTLAWSTTDDVAGADYTPTWDVRHVGNLVVQWDMGAGFSSGARLHTRSGKVVGQLVLDESLRPSQEVHRLPWFTRIDVQLAYAWRPSWGRMRVSLEWFNLTLAEEPIDLVCAGEPRECRTIYIPAIFFPNLGLRGEI